MNFKIISKEEFPELIDLFLKDYVVYAPKLVNGDVSFEKIENSGEVDLSLPNSKKNPKSFFFPQSEDMFLYSINGDGREVQKPSFDEERIIIGVRPCDLLSFKFLDKVFDHPDYKDPYYIEKREKTIIFGLTCNNPQSSCFCNLFNCSPFNMEDADYFLIDEGNNYFLKINNNKLDEIINPLENASDTRITGIKSLEKKALERLNYQVELGRIKNKLEKIFEDPIWERLHEKCLGCGTCTYLCSTCHCFDIVDEEVKKQGRRIRNWDSCMYPLFTLHASGHNPRESGKERMRQRIMHKFNYFVNYWGSFGCVGCGRCIRNCPVNLDIREILKIISEGN